ncbi:MAG: hypothetical protein ABSH46_00515 [Bryobacteraceae bacterium]|jgi:hypothetical protein
MSRGESDLRLAQAAAEGARRLLLFPSVANLDRSRPYLEQACASLEKLRRSMDERPGARKRELVAGLGALRLTVRRVAALLEGAARFRTGWFEALTAATAGGYTREGGPAASAVPRGLSVEG